MSTFNADLKRDLKNERLSSAGVHWNHERATAAAVTKALGFATYAPLTACGFLMLFGENTILWVFVGLCFLGLGALFEALHAEFTTKWAVIFHEDGRIETPYGLPFRSGDRSIEGDHRYVSNIQSERMSSTSSEFNGFEVNFYCANGNIICVGCGLSKHEAHKVTVLLTHALNDIRAAQSDVNNKSTRAQATQNEKERAFID